MVNGAAVKAFLVNGSDGEIDNDLSIAKFLSELELFKTLSAEGNALVSNAVKAVWDKFKGAKINKPGVINFTLQQLNATPDNVKELTLAVQDYLDLNTGNRGEALFGSKKGREGGMVRHEDQDEKSSFYKKVDDEKPAKA